MGLFGMLAGFVRALVSWSLFLDLFRITGEIMLVATRFLSRRENLVRG